MKIENLVQTCPACPSQWEFETDNDRLCYVRYRWGGLQVRVSQPGATDIMDAVGGAVIYQEEISDGLDGQIEWEEVEARIKDLDVEEVVKGQEEP